MAQVVPFRRSAPLPARILLAAVGSLCGIARPEQTPPARPSSGIADKVLRCLSESRGDPGTAVDDAGARIAGLGPEAIPVVLDLLQSESAGPLDPRTEEIAVAALSRFKRGELVGPLGQCLLHSSSTRARSACLRAAGAAFESVDLELLCRAMKPAEVNGDVLSALSRTFEAAVADVLKRDFRSCAVVAGLLRSQPAGVRIVLVAALADTGTAPALSVLSARLGVDPAEDALVLSEIARLAESVPAPVEAPTRDSIRGYLRTEDQVLLQCAISAVGKLEDTDSVRTLIDLLGHENPPVREAAGRALRSITGAPFACDEPRWNAWYEDETAWFAGPAQILIATLRTGTYEKKIAAISELSEHPLFRFEIADILLRTLPAERDGIRRFGCTALGQLGAAQAIPFLEEWIQDPERSVSEEAKLALARIRARRERAP